MKTESEVKTVCLTVQEDSGAELGDAAMLRWSATGLDMPETVTLGNIRTTLAALKLWTDHMPVALADIFSIAKRHGWESEVEQMLMEFEFDVAQVRKSVAIGDVPRALRHPKLNGEHYFVVSRLLYDEQVKWLQRAVKNKMSPLVLKRSIEAGKVLTKDQIEMMSGAGSGILNYHGILTNWQRWEKKVGGEDAILSWPRDVLQRWYEDVKPLGDLIDKAEVKLNARDEQ